MDPHIHEPGISPELEPDGWVVVDRVGAWDSFLCEFRVLQFVPWPHRETWAWAWAEVLRRTQGAEGKALERGLKWLGLLGEEAILAEAMWPRGLSASQ